MRLASVDDVILNETVGKERETKWRVYAVGRFRFLLFFFSSTGRTDGEVDVDAV